MDLAEEIRQAVMSGHFLISRHALQRLSARRILLWQIEAGVADGILIHQEIPADSNPTIVLEQRLPDGASVQVVWAWLASSREALLVTAFEPD